MNVGFNAGIALQVLQEGAQEQYRAYIGFIVAAKGGSFFRKGDGTVSEVADLCNWSRKTAKKRLHQLFSRGWIGKDSKGRFYIHGHDQVCNRLGIESSVKHTANAEFVVSDKKFFKATLFSIVVGVQCGQRRYSLVQKAMHISGAAKRPQYTPGKGERFTPNSLSVSFLGNKLGKSKSTIHRWKMLAIERGLMRRTENEFIFEASNVSALRQAFPDDAYRIHLSAKEGEVGRIRLTDQLESVLSFNG